jgi:hypothetical protein
VAPVTPAHRIAGALAAGLSLYGVYWVVAIVEARVYRTSFLLVALVLMFVEGRGRRGEGRESLGSGEGRPVPGSPIRSLSPVPSPLLPLPSTGCSPRSR